jgi:hypothetical protein
MDGVLSFRVDVGVASVPHMLQPIGIRSLSMRNKIQECAAIAHNVCSQQRFVACTRPARLSTFRRQACYSYCS